MPLDAILDFLPKDEVVPSDKALLDPRQRRALHERRRQRVAQRLRSNRAQRRVRCHVDVHRREGLLALAHADDGRHAGLLPALVSLPPPATWSQQLQSNQEQQVCRPGLLLALHRATLHTHSGLLNTLYVPGSIHSSEGSQTARRSEGGRRESFAPRLHLPAVAVEAPVVRKPCT